MEWWYPLYGSSPQLSAILFSCCHDKRACVCVWEGAYHIGKILPAALSLRSYKENWHRQHLKPGPGDFQPVCLPTGWWFVSTAEEQGWVPATYLNSQSGTRDDSEVGASKAGEGKSLQTLLSPPTHTPTGTKTHMLCWKPTREHPLYFQLSVFDLPQSGENGLTTASLCWQLRPRRSERLSLFACHYKHRA